jgi:hypothetical protein
LLEVIKEKPGPLTGQFAAPHEFPYYRTRNNKKSRFNFTEPHDYLKKFRSWDRYGSIFRACSLSGFGGRPGSNGAAGGRDAYLLHR